jgi:hypothetical protein
MKFAMARAKRDVDEGRPFAFPIAEPDNSLRWRLEMFAYTYFSWVIGAVYILMVLLGVLILRLVL